MVIEVTVCNQILIDLCIPLLGLQQFTRWVQIKPGEDAGQSVNRVIRCSGCKQSATRENKRPRPKLSRKGPLPF